MFDGMKEIVSGPGTDTRQWCSWGQVIPGTAAAPSIRFKDGQGNALPHGVLIDVKLEPSGVVVPCRLISPCAGNGEGEYHPYVAGDEVLVLIPEGDERAGCAIVGRANQAHDAFPATVAGMDVTQNNLGFKRHIMPFVTEVGQSWSVRSAGTNAAITMDQIGQILINGADGALLSMGPDVITLMSKDQQSGLQIDVGDDMVLLKATTASFVLDAANSQFQSKGTLSISASGNPGVNHVTTTEAVTQILSGLLTALAAVLTPQAFPLTGTTLGALLAVPGPGEALIEAALTLAPTMSWSPYQVAIAAGLSAPKVPGMNAGVGSSGFLSD